MTTNHFEFAPARKMMADLLQTADRCRLERMAQIDRALPGMRETLKRAEDTVRTCPAEIAKLEAERDALSELTPEAAVREMLPPPPPAPNRFDCRECGQCVAADEDGCCVTCGRDCAAFEDGVCVVPFPEDATKPAADSAPTEDPFVSGLPPEELRRVWPEWDVAENGHMIGCVKFAGDGTSRWQGSRDWWTVDEKSAIWIGRSFRPHGATRAHVESLAQQSQPAPPALLDLRTLPVGTRVRFLADRGPWQKGDAATTRIQGDGVYLLRDGSAIAAPVFPESVCMPVEVVLHACPRCDEGMREIVIEWDQDSVQTATRLGADGTAIVEIGSESTIYTPNAYRFVRADVPPPSEWCDGKGAQ